MTFLLAPRIALRYRFGMPALLPAISRRQFIGTALAGVAGLAAGCKTLPSSRAASNQDHWVLFSDTHIAEDSALLTRGVNMTRNLEQTVAEVLAQQTRPAGVLVCGDCAYSTGQSGDYQQLVKLLHPLQSAGVPTHLALGNHDNRERFREALPDRRVGSLEHHVALIETPRANWFILDSLEQTNVTPGLLGDAQLQWLANTLDAHPRKPALVMVHHNPGISGNMGLKDTVKLFDIIRPRTQVKAYIYGHTHTWLVEKDDSGIQLINLPPTAYVFKESDPSGWLTATLARDALHLKFHSLTPGHAAQGQEHNLVYRPA